MNPVPPLSHRIVRVVHRFGGSPADAARELGISKDRARRIGRTLGLSWRAPTQRRCMAVAAQILAETK